jgi:hypothetical protein
MFSGSRELLDYSIRLGDEIFLAKFELFAVVLLKFVSFGMLMLSGCLVDFGHLNP